MESHLEIKPAAASRQALLDARLGRRREIERSLGKHPSRHASFLLRHSDFTGKALDWLLRLTRLRQRGRRNALDIQVRAITLEFEDLPPAFDGFRVLHLSDFHIDGVDGLAEALAETLQAVDSDICLMTGDYRFEIFGSCEDVYPRMRTVISALGSPEGAIGILGNHDSAAIAPELEAMGVRMLVNEAVEIRRGDSSIWIAGVDDPWDYECDDLPLALENAPLDAFKILLSHTPELFEEAAHSGVNLYLCGHTHAGQIRLPLLGAPILNANCPPALTAGLWSHRGMHGYTTAGVGCSMLPVRFGCPPELAVIELRRVIF